MSGCEDGASEAIYEASKGYYWQCIIFLQKEQIIQIYPFTLGKEVGYEGIDQLKDAIAQTKGDTQYQLMRVYERYAEVREVMEKEVVPIWVKYNDVMTTGDRKTIMQYQKYVTDMLPKAHPLTQQIVNQVLTLP